MKIQCISNRNHQFKNIKCSPLGNPEAFDSFDINIIDLTYNYDWRSDGSSPVVVHLKEDFNNLKKIIFKCKCQNIVFLLPQDFDVQYNYDFNYSSNRREYTRSSRLKNMLNHYFLNNLKEIGVDFIRSFGFENNHYLMNQKQYDSSFFFDICLEGEVLQRAINSNKAVTVRNDRIICTFLKLENEEAIFDFLNDLKLLNRVDIPKWLDNYVFFDDSALKQDIVNQNQIIETANKRIESDNERINKNIYYKSILICNGEELVKRVFAILDEMLGINLTNEFEDEKKEDFIARLPEITFIGEIKGVTSNVRNEHISQVDNHLSLYEDKLQEENRNENLKKLLIINHQRNTDVLSREEIHINQVNKAKKENVLIVETITLLKLYESFKSNRMANDDLIKLFSEEVGVLKI